MHIHLNLTKPSKFSLESNFCKGNRGTMRYVLMMDKLMCTKIPSHTQLHQPKIVIPTLFYSQLEKLAKNTQCLKPHWFSQKLNGYTKARTKPCFLQNEISFRFLQGIFVTIFLFFWENCIPTSWCKLVPSLHSRKFVL
jgi:hypothetical protein